jgi:hypothetical protein
VVPDAPFILLVPHEHRVVIEVGVLERDIRSTIMFVGHADLYTEHLDLIIAGSDGMRKEPTSALRRHINWSFSVFRVSGVSISWPSYSILSSSLT